MDAERQLILFLNDKGYETKPLIGVQEVFDIMAWKPTLFGLTSRNLVVRVESTVKENMRVSKSLIKQMIREADKNDFEVVLAVRFGRDWRFWNWKKAPKFMYYTGSEDLQTLLDESGDRQHLEFKASDGKSFDQTF